MYVKNICSMNSFIAIAFIQNTIFYLLFKLIQNGAKAKFVIKYRKSSKILSKLLKL